MTEELKGRIAQLSQGEIPTGYHKTKVGTVPEEWEEVHFKDLFTSSSEYTDDLEEYPLYSLTIEDGIVEKSQRYERSHLVKKENAYKVVEPNDYAFNPMNIRFGAVARHRGEHSVSVSGYYDIFTTVHPSDLLFMDSFLTSFNMIAHYNRVSTGSIKEKKRVHFSQFLDFKLPLPTLGEREKIANILASQERLIGLKEKLLEQKKLQKKYLIGQLLTGEQRLSGFSEQWEEVRLSQLLEERKTFAEKGGEYPHVTLGTKGIVPKSERYDRDHLVKKEEKEYKITLLGDICYNPANLKFKVICMNEFGSAIFSPIYVTFETLEKANKLFLSSFLMREDFIQRVRKYEEGSVYERMGVKPKDFLLFQLKIPPLEEQEAIAKIITAANKEVILLERELEAEKRKEKSLKQLLLTGIVRVNYEK